MTKEELLLDIKRQNGNLLAIKWLFEIYFEINKDIIFVNVDEYNEIASEYIDFVIKYHRLNITHTNPIFIKLDNTKKSIENKIKIGEILSDYEDDVRKLIHYKSFYTIHWGINSGKSISEILINNPEYFLWSVVNLVHFSIDNNIFFMLHYFDVDSNYLKAIEINLIKHLIIEKWGTDDDFTNTDEGNNFDDSGPESYGYDSWDDMVFNTAFEGNIDAWNHYNQ